MIISSLYLLFSIVIGSIPEPPVAAELGIGVPVMDIIDGEISDEDETIQLVGFPVSTEDLPEAPVIPPDLKHRLWNGWKRSLIGKFSFHSMAASLLKLLQHREQIGYVIFAILLLNNSFEYLLPSKKHDEDLPYIIDLLADGGVARQTIINACTTKFIRTLKNISTEAALYLAFEAIKTVWTTVNPKQRVFLIHAVAFYASLSAMGFNPGSIGDSLKLSARFEMYEHLKLHLDFLCKLPEGRPRF